MTTDIQIERARAAAAQLRLEGTTATAATRKTATKPAIAAAAGISRPTLDKWITRTEAGRTITTDWTETPEQVTLAGVTITVERRPVAIPSDAHTGHVETAWVLTRPGYEPYGASTTYLYATDLHGMIIAEGEGTIAVFSPADLDTALVFLVSAAVHERSNVVA